MPKPPKRVNKPPDPPPRKIQLTPRWCFYVQQTLIDRTPVALWAEFLAGHLAEAQRRDKAWLEPVTI